MITVYQHLLCLYPGEYRREFGDEMLSVIQEVRCDIEGCGPLAGAAFFIREACGLLSGALHEHLRGTGVFDIRSLLSARRFNMRNGFRFPKSTAILMTIILLGVIVAIRKGEAIANSLPHVNPQIGPIAAGHTTMLPGIAFFFALFWALGLIGWIIMFALHRSGVHRLEGMQGR